MSRSPVLVEPIQHSPALSLDVQVIVTITCVAQLRRHLVRQHNGIILEQTMLVKKENNAALSREIFEVQQRHLALGR